MTRKLIIVGLLAFSTMAFGTVGCSAKQADNASEEPSPEGRNWNADASNDALSFDASEKARELGIVRWKYLAAGKDRIAAEALDAQGVVVGRVDIHTDAAAKRTSAAVNRDGHVSNGVIALNDANEIVENTFPRMDETALAWIETLRADAEAFEADHPAPYAGDFAQTCEFQILKTGLIFAGTAVACAGAAGTGGALIVACAAGVLTLFEQNAPLEQKCKGKGSLG